MQGNLALRDSVPEDAPFLLSVYASTREEELKPVPWTQEQKDAFLRFQFDAQQAHYREHFAGARFDLICLDEKPVGRLYVYRCSDEIRIVDIALLPEARGHGFGRVLIEQLLAESRATHVPVRIHVEKHNPAMRLYTRLGFVPIADRGVYLFLEWTDREGEPRDA
jgi:GNAT superfamily N-acetyltransferase